MDKSPCFVNNIHLSSCHEDSLIMNNIWTKWIGSLSSSVIFFGSVPFAKLVDPNQRSVQPASIFSKLRAYRSSDSCSGVGARDEQQDISSYVMNAPKGFTLIYIHAQFDELVYFCLTSAYTASYLSCGMSSSSILSSWISSASCSTESASISSRRSSAENISMSSSGMLR